MGKQRRRTKSKSKTGTKPSRGPGGARAKTSRGPTHQQGPHGARQPQTGARQDGRPLAGAVRDPWTAAAVGLGGGLERAAVKASRGRGHVGRRRVVRLRPSVLARCTAPGALEGCWAHGVSRAGGAANLGVASAICVCSRLTSFSDGRRTGTRPLRAAGSPGTVASGRSRQGQRETGAEPERQRASARATGTARTTESSPFRESWRNKPAGSPDPTPAPLPRRCCAQPASEWMRRAEISYPRSDSDLVRWHPLRPT